MQFNAISLVIPMFNESPRIDLMFDGIQEFMTVWQADVEVILVNDGSQDDTETKVNAHPVFVQLSQSGQIMLINQHNSLITLTKNIRVRRLS